MCGFAGFINFRNVYQRDAARSAIEGMTGSLAHRGPDGEGVWIDMDGMAALGHRRLAILDLSPLGHQPMASRTGRYILVFNGEIYNFRQLRHDLQKGGPVEFRGASDTEVILECIESWGFETAIHALNGMFAFALWDRKERTLHLARDRFGEKPLYYGWLGNSFAFASEIRALQVHPEFHASTSLAALSLYFKHNYIPAPLSIYDGIHKLEAASWLKFSAATPAASIPARTQYWSAAASMKAGFANPLDLPEEEAVDELQSRLKECVRSRMVADVPLGAFLSGGIDSSVVVALMREVGAEPPRTFTIGFEEPGFNEADHARAVADHLGTRHTELSVTSAHALSIIPTMGSIYDEPFADASQIPTALVSALARRSVTVALTGDGGDELFGGYTRYTWASRLWKALTAIPRPLRHALYHGSTAIPASMIQSFSRIFAAMLPENRRMRNPADKVHRLRLMLRASSPEEVYAEFLPVSTENSALFPGNPHTRPDAPKPWISGLPAPLSFILTDISTYLPDDLLVKVDRASMSVGLEARAPLLDPNLLEFAASLPLSYKIRGNEGKWILRKLAYRYLPKSLLDRPKAGFAVPLDTWLRSGLRSWAGDTFASREFLQSSFLNSRLIRQRWSEHLSGRVNWAPLLWGVLMFQSWLSHQRTGRSLQRLSVATSAGLPRR